VTLSHSRGPQSARVLAQPKSFEPRSQIAADAQVAAQVASQHCAMRLSRRQAHLCSAVTRALRSVRKLLNIHGLTSCMANPPPLCGSPGRARDLQASERSQRTKKSACTSLLLTRVATSRRGDVKPRRGSFICHGQTGPPIGGAVTSPRVTNMHFFWSFLISLRQ